MFKVHVHVVQTTSFLLLNLCLCSCFFYHCSCSIADVTRIWDNPFNGQVSSCSRGCCQQRCGRGVL